MDETDADDFKKRVEDAWEWWGAAIEESQEGRWVRDAVEREVLADITAATNPLHDGRLPPFPEDSWHVRIGRVANWAGALRLAARAGGWELQPIAGRTPPQPAGMAELLSGIYAVGRQGEVWSKQLLSGGGPPAEADIAAAECFLHGPGSMDDLQQFFYD
ncbi:hypothetical protein AB0A69_23345 [Streptomyces sp. NPDC045431]|uniref:hypothetical protein n=1 Tax=Streptomyces sp. NPDC045431 TaxID=3155613 RepID=UPI0033CBE0DE